MHDPRRHLERFAGEADARERLELLRAIASRIVEIRARFIRQQHGLGIEGIDQPRGDPDLGPEDAIEFVIAAFVPPFVSVSNASSSGKLAFGLRLGPARTAPQAMMSGMLRSATRSISSLQAELALLEPRELKLVANPPARQCCDLLVEAAMLDLERLNLRAWSRRHSSLGN